MRRRLNALLHSPCSSYEADDVEIIRKRLELEWTGNNWIALDAYALWLEFSVSRSASFLIVATDSLNHFIEWLKEDVPDDYTGGVL